MARCVVARMVRACTIVPMVAVRLAMPVAVAVTIAIPVAITIPVVVAAAVAVAARAAVAMMLAAAAILAVLAMIAAVPAARTLVARRAARGFSPIRAGGSAAAAEETHDRASTGRASTVRARQVPGAAEAAPWARSAAPPRAPRRPLVGG